MHRALFVVAALGLTPVLAAAETLNDAVRLAVETHPRIRQAAAETRVNEAGIRELQGRYLPSVDVFASVGRESVERPGSVSVGSGSVEQTPREIRLEVEQVLFDGFSRVNAVKRRVEETNASTVRLTAEREAVALETVRAYVDLYRQQNILMIVDESVAVHERYLQVIEREFAGGTGTRGDVEQARERLAATRALRSDVLQSIGVAEARVGNLVGRPLATVEGPAGPEFVPENVGSASELAMRDNSLVRAVARDVEAARFAIAETESEYYPTLSLVGRAQRAEDLSGVDDEDNRLFAGVELSWNIYEGGATTARKRAAMERLDSALQRRQVALREVQETVDRTWSDIAATDDLIGNLLQREQSAIGVVRAYRQEYDAGARDFLDLLNAEATLLNTRVEIVTARAVRIIALYNLAATIGTLDDEFDLPEEAVALTPEDFTFLPF